MNDSTSITCRIDVSYHFANTPPVIFPSTFSLPLFSPENTLVGTAIAYDVDYNQTLSFSITGHPSFTLPELAFQIQEESGDIYLTNSDIFFSNLDSVNITVLVEDSGVPALSSSSSITNVLHS